MSIPLNVVTTSREMVKPSSPTPKQLRTYKLSLLDQVMPPDYLPFIFFYQPPRQDDESVKQIQVCRRLKQSLSYVLTKFYPMAGRIIEGNNSSIDCNDEGVEYIEARVMGGACLAQLVEDPKMEELQQFLPFHPYRAEEAANRTALLSVKVSVFDSSGGGGLAVGVCIDHKIGDVASLVTFMDSWARAHINPSDDINPICSLADLFPVEPSISPQVRSFPQRKFRTKILVFDKEKIEKLKQIITESSGSGKVRNPTRVEAVSAFLWQRFIQLAAAKKADENTPIMASAFHAVNIRPRADPPLPEYSFGNYSRPTLTEILSVPCEHVQLNSTDPGVFLSTLVEMLRPAIRKIDAEYIKQLQINGVGLMNDFMTQVIERLQRGSLSCAFSSWCRFPAYGVDFGRGKPVRVCTITIPLNNYANFMSTPCGDGIEAWLTLADDDDDIQVLEEKFNHFRPNF